MRPSRSTVSTRVLIRVRLLVVGVDDRHVAHVDRSLLDDQATGAGAASGLTGLGVAGHPVDALDEHALGLGVDGDDLAAAVALSLPVSTWTVSPFLIFIFFLSAMAQSTSGANEMIFMNFFSRSSRPTGPKMRVPRGSPSALRMTAAFSSNLM